MHKPCAYFAFFTAQGIFLRMKTKFLNWEPNRVSVPEALTLPLQLGVDRSAIALSPKPLKGFMSKEAEVHFRASKITSAWTEPWESDMENASCEQFLVRHRNELKLEAGH